MTLVLQPPERMSRPPRERTAPDDTHDLPLLAAQENPRSPTPWDRLLEEGVQPALILGAERRTSGTRKP